MTRDGIYGMQQVQELSVTTTDRAAAAFTDQQKNDCQLAKQDLLDFIHSNLNLTDRCESLYEMSFKLECFLPVTSDVATGKP